jgi:hypothetical protein
MYSHVVSGLRTQCRRNYSQLALEPDLRHHFSHVWRLGIAPSSGASTGSAIPPMTNTLMATRQVSTATAGLFVKSFIGLSVRPANSV